MGWLSKIWRDHYYSLCSIKFRRIRSTDVFHKNSKNWNSVCSTCLYCTAPEFNANAVPALRNIKPAYVRYNTFFHAPKNNERESNLTLITWFPHRRPLYRWMCLIKRIVLVTGLVILKLTQPLIPAKYPNSLQFNGTEGVKIRCKLHGPNPPKYLVSLY